MIGYWDKESPVKTSHANVKATVYVKGKQTLIAIGNFNDKDQNIKLSFDWKTLGLTPGNTILDAPEIKDFQQAVPFGVNDTIPVKSKQGWLLILQEN
ncbi:hypothetical protein BSYN_19480 [Bacteroides sedimenti]|uniref:Glycoside hydrolase 123-like N-terminal domain-containing protein n=1 Tax=Bacteroides sedimenti TaxID=2136147 RepID=A0ABM8IH94_9BACE